MINWIETYTGKKIDPFHLEVADVDIRDVVHGLSLNCRFHNQCECFYSSAQHAVVVEEIIGILGKGMDTEQLQLTALTGLLHDASDYLLPDMSRVIKEQLPGFIELEKVIQGTILKAFGISGGEWSTVHIADKIAALSEAKILMISEGRGYYQEEQGFAAMSGLDSLQGIWSPYMAKEILTIHITEYRSDLFK